MPKKGLGRGLDALLPELSDLSALTVTDVSLTDIDRNPEQPRRDFDEQALRQLADSIREAGVLQPLLVVRDGRRYRIVAGERRFRAARLAGLTSVPCIVRELTQAQQMEAALIENLQREDLNAIEEATAVRSLMSSCGYTQEQAAQRLGKSRPAIANLLRLLALPKAVQEMVVAGTLSAGHARVLAALKDERQIVALAQKCVAQGMSVRTLEQLAAASPAAPKRPPRPLPLELQEMEGRLRETLGMRATLTGTRRRGKIVLQYYTEGELERLYELLETLGK